MKVLVSLMRHPEKTSLITPDMFAGIDDVEVFTNTKTGYANAVKFAIGAAIGKKCHLIIADTDGYHPVRTITELIGLAKGLDFTRVPTAVYDAGLGHMWKDGLAMVKPYRANIGIQSEFFSFIYDIRYLTGVRDVTGGMYLMSYEFMCALGALESEDMTIHVEIMTRALRMDCPVLQRPYRAGTNPRENSKRTKRYQLKLLGAIFR